MTPEDALLEAIYTDYRTVLTERLNEIINQGLIDRLQAATQTQAAR